MAELRLLLCTDLDRTLLPNGEQPESAHARTRFATLAAHPPVILVFVSGRDRALVDQAIAEYQLPLPDFVISDVGANIYDLRGGDWQLWRQWHARIAPGWGDFGHSQLSELLAHFEQLTLQQADKQNTYKLSYYIPVNADIKQLRDALLERLQAHHIDANLIWSVDEQAGVGLLDILPARADKLQALNFLRGFLSIPLAQTVFAGDSGNDLPVLASAIPSILVANAHPCVARAAIAASESAGTRQALYLARGGFLGMNGNYSAGILEGVSHYHPELNAIFQ